MKNDKETTAQKNRGLSLIQHAAISQWYLQRTDEQLALMVGTTPALVKKHREENGFLRGPWTEQKLTPKKDRHDDEVAPEDPTPLDSPGN